MARALAIIKCPVDLAFSLAMMVVFGLICPLIAAPRLLVEIIRTDRASAFQKANQLFYRVFFWCLKSMVPGVGLKIDPAIRDLRGLVVVCNHVSFLDSILLVSLFDQHKTLVSPGLFKVPLLGWPARMAGYLPTRSSSILAGLEGLQAFFDGGGVLFVFPEGTRSRDGALGPFKKGAFAIARRCRVPLAALRVMGTERVFPPGAWLLDTCRNHRMHLQLLGHLDDRQVSAHENPVRLMEHVRLFYEGG